MGIPDHFTRLIPSAGQYKLDQFGEYEFKGEIIPITTGQDFFSEFVFQAFTKFLDIIDC